MSEHRMSVFKMAHEPGECQIAPDNLGPDPVEDLRLPTAERFFSFDERYLRLLVAGNSDTERHFVDYFSALLRVKLQSRLRRAQDVDDLRQEVFLRVLQALRSGPGLQHPGKLGAFVNSVCNNVILEHLRSKSRTKQWDQDTAEPRATDTNVERDLLAEEVHDQVRIVLDNLPVKDRNLIRAVFLEERDKDDVCCDYGVKREYLRVLLHRARRRIRDLLTSPGGASRTAARSLGSAG